MASCMEICPRNDERTRDCAPSVVFTNLHNMQIQMLGKCTKWLAVWVRRQRSAGRSVFGGFRSVVDHVRRRHDHEHSGRPLADIPAHMRLLPDEMNAIY